MAIIDQCDSRLSSGMPIDKAAAWYQLLDSNRCGRFIVLRLVLIGFLSGAVRLFRRSARLTRTETSPFKWRSLLRRYNEIEPRTQRNVNRAMGQIQRGDRPFNGRVRPMGPTHRPRNVTVRYPWATDRSATPSRHVCPVSHFDLMNAKLQVSNPRGAQ